MEETVGVASMVSYLIQVDLETKKVSVGLNGRLEFPRWYRVGCSLIVWLCFQGEKMIDGWIDLVKKQPLGIAHLRQYLVPSQGSDVE